MLFDLINGRIASVEEFIVTLLSLLFVIFCTMPVHEAAHAFTANKLGDSTAKYSGRLTLNPLKHINYMGALLILVFGFGWAEPVPVNQWNLKKPKKDMALIAAAGPVSNLLMGFILLIISNIIILVSKLIIGYVDPVLPGDNAIYLSSGIITYRIIVDICTFFYYAAWINVCLAVFNLIPIPPLDGSRILGAFLPNNIYYKLQSIERYSFIIVMVLAATGALSSGLGYISNHVFDFIDTVASLPFALF